MLNSNTRNYSDLSKRSDTSMFIKLPAIAMIAYAGWSFISLLTVAA